MEGKKEEVKEEGRVSVHSSFQDKDAYAYVVAHKQRTFPTVLGAGTPKTMALQTRCLVGTRLLHSCLLPVPARGGGRGSRVKMCLMRALIPLMGAPSS